MPTDIDELSRLEQEKWDAMRRQDGDTLRRFYDENAISIGYGSDGSLGARRTHDLVTNLADLDLRELSLSGFELVPLGESGAVLTYRAAFHTGRGLETTVLASSVWQRRPEGWKTMFFQATGLTARMET